MKDFILPDIGEGIVECEIVEWKVKEGDVVTEDQPICDVMTDKALVEIPSKFDGKVSKLYYKKGDIAKVHQPLFCIESQGLSQGHSNIEDHRKQDSSEIAKKYFSKNDTNIQNNSHCDNIENKKVVSSPAVRRIAREMHVDLHEVTGSGMHGRIYKDDIYAFLETTKNKTNSSSGEASSMSNDSSNKVRKTPIDQVMKMMAKKMTQSVQTIPHFTFSEDIDVTQLKILRNELKAEFKEQDIKLTMMPFFIKALSLALKQFPQINIQTDETCQNLYYFDDHNIGFAIYAKTGLLVPNIKCCQNKSLYEIADEFTSIIKTARDGKVNPSALKGGTISISNIGTIGGTVTSPIINYPEAAIVALGKINTLPRFNETGAVSPKDIMNVSWSADHRIIDGATIASFNNLWKDYIEQPSKMLVKMV